MKFVCDRCQTKYSIADERVRGKVLKVKCKTCANVITVREARRASSAGEPSLSAAGARPRTGANLALNIPMETPGVDSERTQLAQSPFAPEFNAFPDLGAGAGAFAPPSPVASKKKPTTGPIPAVGAADDGVQWYLALDGNRTGPFSRQKLVDRLMPLGKDADVHIWNDRLDGWKPPAEVPAIAGEIARRRVPAPPPLPGAPRRPTPPPMPPVASLSHGLAGRKPTPHPHPHQPPSPVGGHGAGPGSKLPPPSGVHPVLAARGAAAEAASDPSSLLETPAPMPHMMPHAAKSNGVGHSGTHAPPKPVNSDVMQMLNMPGGTQTAPGAPPRLMSLTEALAPGAALAAPRSRSAIYVVGLLGVIGLVVVVVLFGLRKPVKAPPVVAVKPPVVETPEPPVEKTVEPPPPPPVAPVEPPPPTRGKARGKQARQVKAPTPTPPPPPTGGDEERFRDNHKVNVSPTGPAVRPPPAQADIMKVIGNNRAGIKVCYQRALTRDNTLTHGKLAVKLSIGISGRVKHVALDGPTQFRLLLEPCLKEVVQRWVFPQASEEYAAEFPLVFQGNE